MPSNRSMRYAAISRRGSDWGWICIGLNAARAPDAKSRRSDSDEPPRLILTRVTGVTASGASSSASGAPNTVSGARRAASRDRSSGTTARPDTSVAVAAEAWWRSMYALTSSGPRDAANHTPPTAPARAASSSAMHVPSRTPESYHAADRRGSLSLRAPIRPADGVARGNRHSPLARRVARPSVPVDPVFDHVG